MARAERDKMPLGRRPWVCNPNFLLCPNEHLFALYKAGYRGDLRRLDGHAFFECRECTPSTYFLAVFTSRPDPNVTCYEISRDSYIEWDKSEEGTPPTAELLYRLRDPDGNSHNPYYRPPR